MQSFPGRVCCSRRRRPWGSARGRRILRTARTASIRNENLINHHSTQNVNDNFDILRMHGNSSADLVFPVISIKNVNQTKFESNQNWYYSCLNDVTVYLSYYFPNQFQKETWVNYKEGYIKLVCFLKTWTINGFSRLAESINNQQ